MPPVFPENHPLQTRKSHFIYRPIFIDQWGSKQSQQLESAVSELTNAYDFYYAFEILYSGVDDELGRIIGRSPLSELRFCLQLEDQILRSIQQPRGPDIRSIPGELSIPSTHFLGRRLLVYGLVRCRAVRKFLPLRLYTQCGYVGADAFTSEICRERVRWLQLSVLVSEKS